MLIAWQRADRMGEIPNFSKEFDRAQNMTHAFYLCEIMQVAFFKKKTSGISLEIFFTRFHQTLELAMKNEKEKRELIFSSVIQFVLVIIFGQAFLWQGGELVNFNPLSLLCFQLVPLFFFLFLLKLLEQFYTARPLLFLALLFKIELMSEIGGPDWNSVRAEIDSFTGTSVLREMRESLRAGIESHEREGHPLEGLLKSLYFESSLNIKVQRERLKGVLYPLKLLGVTIAFLIAQMPLYLILGETFDSL